LVTTGELTQPPDSAVLHNTAPVLGLKEATPEAVPATKYRLPVPMKGVEGEKEAYVN
jgi:hypothetical protein